MRCNIYSGKDTALKFNDLTNDYIYVTIIKSRCTTFLLPGKFLCVPFWSIPALFRDKHSSHVVVYINSLLGNILLYEITILSFFIDGHLGLSLLVMVYYE